MSAEEFLGAVRREARVDNWLWATVLGLAVVVAPFSLHAGEDVEAVISRGVELRRAGRDREALVQFQRALKMQKTSRVQAQVAVAEQALGLWVAAEADLLAAMASEDDPWITKNRATLATALTAIRGHLGSLEVWGTPTGATILVNEKVVGKLPLSGPVRLTAEIITLKAHAEGYSEVNRSVRILVDETAREHIELVRISAPVAAVASAATSGGTMRETPPPDDRAQEGSGGADGPSRPSSTLAVGGEASATENHDASGNGRALRPWAWITAAGAAGGLIFGTVETVMAAFKKNEFENHTGPNPNNSGMIVQDCFGAKLTTACRPIADAHDQAVKLAVVGYAIGGALAMGSLVLFILSSGDDHVQETALACLPDPVNAAIACHFRF